MSSRFVVHEHHAAHLHYDFRLESEGILRSWVLPKGPSMNPSEKRLAIAVEDHPVEYIEFEGIIPVGRYGAGPVVIWDKGTYEPVEVDQGKISFILHGERLKGTFTLTYLKGRGKGNEWLLIKRKDQYATSSWRLEPGLTPEKHKELKERIPPCEAI
jgi:bifunctional non-homologous end joining protein LigD